MLAAFVLWRGAGWLAAAAVPVVALVALAPWVIRNKVELGCYAITTDARSLWKANNPNTYKTLAERLVARPGPGPAAAGAQAHAALLGHPGGGRRRATPRTGS